MNLLLKQIHIQHNRSFRDNLIFFGLVHDEISKIQNSIDVLILGKEVYSSLYELGQQIVELRVDVMVKRETDNDEIYNKLTSLILEISNIIEGERKIIIDKYYSF